MTLTTFEDRLLAELRAVVAARPAPDAATPAPTRRARRTRLVVATGAVAGAAVGVFIAIGGDTSTPAYAVAKQSYGSVTVEIASLRDASGLEAKLRAAGIPAVVDYTPMGKICRVPRGRTAPGHPATSMGMDTRDGGLTSFTIPRGSVRPGETLVVMSSVGSGVSSVGIEIVEGPVAPCELVDAPPPGAPGPGSGPRFRTGRPSSGAASGGASTQTRP